MGRISLPKKKAPEVPYNADYYLHKDFKFRTGIEKCQVKKKAVSHLLKRLTKPRRSVNRQFTTIERARMLQNLKVVNKNWAGLSENIFPESTI